MRMFLLKSLYPCRSLGLGFKNRSGLTFYLNLKLLIPTLMTDSTVQRSAGIFGFAQSELLCLAMRHSSNVLLQAKSINALLCFELLIMVSTVLPKNTCTVLPFHWGRVWQATKVTCIPTCRHVARYSQSNWSRIPVACCNKWTNNFSTKNVE